MRGLFLLMNREKQEKGGLWVEKVKGIFMVGVGGGLGIPLLLGEKITKQNNKNCVGGGGGGWGGGGGGGRIRAHPEHDIASAESGVWG